MSHHAVTMSNSNSVRAHIRRIESYSCASPVTAEAEQHLAQDAQSVSQATVFKRYKKNLRMKRVQRLLVLLLLLLLLQLILLSLLLAEYSSLENSFEDWKSVLITSIGQNSSSDSKQELNITLRPRCGSILELVIGGEGHSFHDPWGVDINSTTNRIYVADQNNHRICVYTMNGLLIICYDSFETLDKYDDNFVWPRGIAVATDNQLVVGDNHRVMVLSLTNMRVLKFWGMRDTSGNELGQFYHPMGIAVYKELIYVADWGNNRVQVLNRLNKDIFLLNADDTDSISPFDIAINFINDHIYVVNDTNVVEYDITGQYLATISPADLNQRHINLRSIAIDSQGQVYLSDLLNGCIHVIARDGDYLQRLGHKGTCPNCLMEPEGIAVHNGTGKIVVTDISKNEVHVYVPLD